jgi:hypothetical protein
LCFFANLASRKLLLVFTTGVGIVLHHAGCSSGKESRRECKQKVISQR